MRLLVVFTIIIAWLIQPVQGQFIRYTGTALPGKGKHIVMISGDEEYRSEEALPMLAKILAQKYGFTCTVLFALDSAGYIDPMNVHNIPGLKNLRSADLLVLFTRFRELPDSQMKYIDEYLLSGRPVIGMRTATHAFRYPEGSASPFAKYSFDSKVDGWEMGFGRKVLGDTWVAHQGIHGKEGTRALVNGRAKRGGNPILNGVKDIWVPSDVYAVAHLEETAVQVLLYGQCTKGMSPEAPVNLDKAIMPVAWTGTYLLENGKRGKVFTTTMGASVDLQSEDLRRLIVNACFWALGMEQSIPAKADVDIVGAYAPQLFGFGKHTTNLKPADID